MLTCVQRQSQHIPAQFRRDTNLPSADTKVTLLCEEVPTSCKAIWEGNKLQNPRLNAEGWMNFSLNHFLEEGDICVFELFSKSPFRIKVRIFRVVMRTEDAYLDAKGDLELKRQVVLDWRGHYQVLDANLVDTARPTATTPPQKPKLRDTLT